MHVRADGRDRRTLPGSQILRQQRGSRALTSVLAQSHHLAVHNVRQHGPESLAFASLDLVESDVTWLPLRASLIPPGEKRLLRSAGLAPADSMAERRVTRRHRLTVHANLLAQSPRDPRFRIREIDPLGPNSTPPTDHATLLIHQRHRMCGPGQIVPGPLLRRSHARRASTTPTAGIAPAAPLHMDPQSTMRLLLPLDPHDPESGQAQNPRTIPPRSHASSLVGSTTRENDTGWSGAKGDRSFDVQTAEQTAHPKCGPRRRAGYYLRSL